MLSGAFFGFLFLLLLFSAVVIIKATGNSNLLAASMSLSASVSGSTVKFTMSPSANNVMALLVYNSSNQVVADSGPLSNGQTSYTWNVPPVPAGDYHAQVFAYGTAAYSNVAVFTLFPPWTLVAPTYNTSNGDVTFNFTPAANGFIGLVVKDTSNNTVAYDSGAIPSGYYANTWSNASGNSRIGNYRAVLVYGTAEVSNVVNFSVNFTPPASKWILAQPTVNSSNGDVTFNFTPAANGNFAVVVKNISTNAVAYDSGAIPSGYYANTWSSAPNGSYRAVLVYATSEISNAVTFSVNAIPVCVFSPTTITAGGTIGIIPARFTTNTIPVVLVGTVFGNSVPVGSIPNGGGSVTIPVGTAGVYNVVLGPTGASTICKGSFNGVSTGSLTVNALVLTPAVMNPAIVGCKDSAVQAYFTWTPASGTTFDNQLLDFSDSAAHLLSGQYYSLSVKNQTSNSRYGFVMGAQYAFRIRSVYGGTAALSVVSNIQTFTSPVGCPAVSDPANPVKISCTNGVVTGVFYWKPAVVASGSSLDIQRFSIGNQVGSFFGKFSMTPGATSKSFSSLSAETTLYWRVESHIKNGTTLISDTWSVTTPQCLAPVPILQPVAYPANAILCSDSPYEVTLSWLNKGSGWYVDVSDDINFGHYWNKQVNNLTSTVALTGFNGAGTNPVLLPGKTYFWRVWNTQTETTANYENSIHVNWCHPPFDATYPSGWSTDHGTISQGPNTSYTHNDYAAESIDITQPYATGVKATLDGTISIICIDGISNAISGCGGLGNAVVLSNHGFTVTYGHFSGFASNIDPNNYIGQKVHFGDVIGYIGCTGDCTGNHVHYQFNGLKMAMSNPGNTNNNIPQDVPQGCNSEAACGVSW